MSDDDIYGPYLAKLVDQGQEAERQLMAMAEKATQDEIDKIKALSPRPQQDWFIHHLVLDGDLMTRHEIRLHIELGAWLLTPEQHALLEPVIAYVECPSHHIELYEETRSDKSIAGWPHVRTGVRYCPYCRQEAEWQKHSQQ